MPKDKSKQKGAELEYVDHPVEVARVALREAAALEWELGGDGNRSCAGTFASLADTLPKRKPILKAVTKDGKR